MTNGLRELILLGDVIDLPQSGRAV